jgi:hypothetical protein
MDTITIDCECGKEIELALNQMKPETSLICPACGITISFEGADMENEVSKIDSELNKFSDKFEKL